MTRERNRADDLDAERLMVLGRLAGGVAHDFNNQLTSIIGYADLLLEELPEDAPSRADLLEIRRAAERAHLVTTHLLGFNRPRDAEPALISVAATLMSHLHLLRRVLGEDIRIATAINRDAIDHDGDLVRADPSHLGHVLLCLGVDARQALPHGGTLTIETRNVGDDAAQPRVRIATMTTPRETEAADSTNGTNPADAMDAAQDSDGRPQRSVIDAIVRQAGGAVRYEDRSSRERHATIELPRIERPAGDASAIVTPPRGTERVLIVEDDATVREVMRRTLERYGYLVGVAGHSRTAMLAAAREPIDLAIVDIVLTDRRGDVLTNELRALRREMRVLYISGRVRLDAPDFYLRKPFSPNQLLIAVRQALDSSPPAARDQNGRSDQR